MLAREYSDAVQDYLRAIYKIQSQEGRATTTAIAKSLGVTAASATGMVTKLAERGLVIHQPYRGVKLTSDGELAALEMVRHHRLLERYLAESLEVSLEDVHLEADRLEHALSESLEAQIDASLGYPTHDPHGAPIPDANLHFVSEELKPLVLLRAGESAKIHHFAFKSDVHRQEVKKLKLSLGMVVENHSARSEEGSITVSIDGNDQDISLSLARHIYIA